MGDRVSGLAKRVNAALANEEARKRAEVDAQRAAEEAERARAAALEAGWRALGDDLAVLVNEIGVLSLVRQAGTIVITATGARNVRFTRWSDGVNVDVAGYKALLELDDDAWVLVLDQDRRPLWDEGVLYLLVEGLGLPRPEPDPIDDVALEGLSDAPAEDVAGEDVAGEDPPPRVIEPELPTILEPVTDPPEHGAKKHETAPPGSALRELKPLW